MTIAEMSLHVNLSIKFVNEPGIDAGGLKREFYDMVGNEMKNEKNPFFLEVNKDRIEYFLNPEILRNKYLLIYIEKNASTWKCGESILQMPSSTLI